ncbi:MAG: hypothetical protein ACLFUZ_01170 [Candidatus Micrarchaeia archaeon]
MGNGQKQKKAPKKEEEPYLRGLTPRRIGELTIKLAKGTKDMVLTAVGIVNLAGCAPVSEYEDRDAGAGGTDSEEGLDASFPEQDTAHDTSEWETDTETTEQEIWWPAHIITFEGGEEILHNVSLKFNDTGLEIWEMKGGYPSEESIPEELKEENREVLRNVLEYSKFFF